MYCAHSLRNITAIYEWPLWLSEFGTASGWCWPACRRIDRSAGFDPKQPSRLTALRCLLIKNGCTSSRVGRSAFTLR
jgi:hypothetical protein